MKKIDKIDKIKFTIVTIWAFMLSVFLCNIECSAQEKKSDWEEVTTIEVPYDVEIVQGVTRNGNPKYYIDIEDTQIIVSENNYIKFKNKEIVLVIVEWYNPETNKYRYTTRQKKQSNITKKLNIDELW